MKLKLVKPAMDKAPGAVVDVNDDHAQILIDKGYAVTITIGEAPATTPKETVSQVLVRTKALSKAS